YIEEPTATTTTTTTTSSTTTDSTSTTTTASPTTTTTHSTSVITTTSPPTKTIKSTVTATAPATQANFDYDGTPILANAPGVMDTLSPILGVGTLPTTTPTTIATTDKQTSERPIIINETAKNAPKSESFWDNIASSFSQGSNGSSVFKSWIIYRILLGSELLTLLGVKPGRIL
ncbi:unnamed protein product, partial [Allacma fusca]